MIRASHMDPASYEDRELDRPLGFGTGASVIFGATGGVMEAALRSAYFLVVGRIPLPMPLRRFAVVMAGARPSSTLTAASSA